MATQEEMAAALRAQQPAPAPAPAPRTINSQPAPPPPAPATFGNISGPITPQHMQVQALRAMPSMQQPPQAPPAGAPPSGPSMPQPGGGGATGPSIEQPTYGGGNDPYRVPRVPVPAAKAPVKKKAAPKKKKDSGGYYMEITQGPGAVSWHPRNPGKDYVQVNGLHGGPVKNAYADR